MTRLPTNAERDGAKRAVDHDELMVRIAALTSPTRGITRGLLKSDTADKLIPVRVMELRKVHSALRDAALLLGAQA